MLYVFYGSDAAQAANKAHALVASLRAKKPDASYVPINADNWSQAVIGEHIGGQGLFSSKYIVFVDRVTENAEAKESLPESIPAMQESENIFILLEAKPNAELKKALEKSAEKVVVCEEKEAGRGGAFMAKGDFNIFALANALGARDPVKAWMIYRQAIDSGIEPENIIGILFWQAKSMVLKHAGNYSPVELKGLLAGLISIYHDGHRGILDPELSIERLLLDCAKH